MKALPRAIASLQQLVQTLLERYVRIEEERKRWKVENAELRRRLEQATGRTHKNTFHYLILIFIFARLPCMERVSVFRLIYWRCRTCAW